MKFLFLFLSVLFISGTESRLPKNTCKTKFPPGTIFLPQSQLTTLAATGINPDLIETIFKNESETPVVFTNNEKIFSTPEQIKQFNLKNIRYEGHRLFYPIIGADGKQKEPSKLPEFTEHRFGYLTQLFRQKKIPVAQQVSIINDILKNYPKALSTTLTSSQIAAETKPSHSDIYGNKTFHNLAALNQALAMASYLKKYNLPADTIKMAIYAITSMGPKQLLADEIAGSGTGGKILLKDMEQFYKRNSGNTVDIQGIKNYLMKPASQAAFAVKQTSIVVPVTKTSGIKLQLPFDAMAVAVYHNGPGNAVKQVLSPSSFKTTAGIHVPSGSRRWNYAERLAANYAGMMAAKGKAMAGQVVKL